MPELSVKSMNPRHGLALGLVAVGLLVLTPSAQAAESTDVFKTTFGSATSSPANPYPLGGNTGDGGLKIAVDNSGGPSDGDVYVVDGENVRVEKFDSAGNLLLMFGKEVNKTKVEAPGSTLDEENLCVIASGDVCQAGFAPGPGKVFQDAFKTPRFIAVDSSSGPSSGDVYIGDNSFLLNAIYKYDSSGHLDTSWGEEGRLVLPPGTQSNRSVSYLEVDQNGDLYVSTGGGGSGELVRLSESGSELGHFISPVNGGGGMAIDVAHDFYEISIGEGPPGLYKFTDAGTLLTRVTDSNVVGTFNFTVDPTNDDLYVTQPIGGDVVLSHFDGFCGNLCTPFDTLGAGKGLDLGFSVTVGKSPHRVYSLGLLPSGKAHVAVFENVGPLVSAGSFVGADETTATVTGHVDPNGHGPITECRVDYGPAVSPKFTDSAPCAPDTAANPPTSHFSLPQDVTGNLTGLAPGTPYRYRFFASNGTAKVNGIDGRFGTASAPSVNSFTSSHVTATTAELNAKIDPRGGKTSYRFEYGTTAGYGQVAPVPDGEIATGLFSEHDVSITLENLQVGVVYHFRVVAENQYGSTYSPDQTFNFYPPSCPNQAIRQQTGASSLPDCRGYELVTPENQGSALIFPSGAPPSLGLATNPSKLAYSTWAGIVSGINGSPPNKYGDLHVATRTAGGWISKYVGLPSTVSSLTGAPPYRIGGAADTWSRGVLADPSLSRVVAWNGGEYETRNEYFGNGPGTFSSMAPYVWDTTSGELVDRWPTNLGAIPNGEDFFGETIASGDLSHFVFNSDIRFAPGGVPGVPGVPPAVPSGIPFGVPGDVYDNDTVRHEIRVASRAPGGAPLQVSPALVSDDGSHVVMSGPLNYCAEQDGFGEGFGGWTCPAPLTRPVELYVRADGILTYEVAPGHEVRFVDMTADGEKIYFTSAAPLTGDDTDTSTDLYMWSEAGEESAEPLTLVSIGNGGVTGNTDLCTATWIEKCGVRPISFEAYSAVPGGATGNGVSDSSMASETGEIYFFSPEKLDGPFGLNGGSNLYLYRNGTLTFVSTFSNSPTCIVVYGSKACSESPIARMNVSPDGAHAAFVTTSQLTTYDNRGQAQMYTYDPAEKHIECVSCIPDGTAPEFGVRGSQSGLFMANDGRAFFSTVDAVVPQDTNQTEDVYEFVGGRPQLISGGTAAATTAEGVVGITTYPGLVGVSADGADVYFATFDVLVGQDRNGDTLKIYDARTGGGFPFDEPPPGCAAADECHGIGSSPSAVPVNGSGAVLGSGGNLRSKAPRSSRRRNKRHKKINRAKAQHKHHGGGRRG